MEFIGIKCQKGKGLLKTKLLTCSFFFVVFDGHIVKMQNIIGESCFKTSIASFVPFASVLYIGFIIDVL